MTNRRAAALFLLLLVCTVWQRQASGADQKRLLVIGDSLTKGLYATSETSGYKHLLAGLAGMELGSCYGSGLAQMLTCWDEYRVWQPDTVVIEIGLNDVSDVNGTAVQEGEWEATYLALVQDMQASGAAVVVTTMFYGVTPNNPNFDKYLRYNQSIGNIASATGATFADVWAGTRNCPDCLSRPGTPSPFPIHWDGDNFHPSNYGHERMAQIIYEAMQQNRVFLPVVNQEQ